MAKTYLPYHIAGKIVHGFGRGSKALGIPTANLPEDAVESLPGEFENGIYYGWASLLGEVYKMVASVGWNPFYKNDKKSMEVHLINTAINDFYGEQLKVVVLGYIRCEKDFSSVDALITAIKGDISYADKILDEPKMYEYKSDPFLTN